MTARGDLAFPLIGLLFLCIYLGTFLFESEAPLYFYVSNLTSMKSRIWSNENFNETNSLMVDSNYDELTDSSSTPVPRPLPIFLAWTKFHSRHMIHVLRKMVNCEYQCFVTANKSYLPIADFVVHHGADLSTRQLVKNYYPNQKKVFFMRESPGRNNDRFYSGWKRIPMSYFNITLTYLRRSDYWERYDYFFEKTENPDEPIYTENDVTEAIRQKVNGSLFITSHCGAESSRDGVVRKLERLTPVTRLGKCARKSCDRDCAKAMIKTHYFYLAFENSICEEYITEKFFKMKQLIVPITFERKLLEHLAPADSFIAVDDYCSLEELAKHLKYLMDNPQEYRKYFNWTKKYSRVRTIGSLCSLCRDAHLGQVRTTNYAEGYTTISSFMPRSKCHNGFGKRLQKDRCIKMN